MKYILQIAIGTVAYIIYVVLFTVICVGWIVWNINLPTVDKQFIKMLNPFYLMKGFNIWSIKI